MRALLDEPSEGVTDTATFESVRRILSYYCPPDGFRLLETDEGEEATILLPAALSEADEAELIRALTAVIGRCVRVSRELSLVGRSVTPHPAAPATPAPDTPS